MADQDQEMHDQQQHQFENGNGHVEETQSGEGAGNAAAEASHDDGGAAAATPVARDDDRKLFVGGLSWDTTEKDLRDHFSQYGEIDSINVKTDPNTGRSRGFAFVVFKTLESVEQVIAIGEHTIKNKKVEPKKAKAKQGKIFVGGLSSEVSDAEIREFFQKFGAIADIELPFDKKRNQRKGFCFITYESEQVVNELLKNPKQIIGGKEVDVKRATPKPEGMQFGGGFRGPPGVRGARNGRPGPGGPKANYGQGWGGSANYGGYSNYGGGYPGGYGGYGGYDNYGGGFGGYANYGGYGAGGGYGAQGGYGYGQGGGHQENGRSNNRH
ncbi:RNA-binding protein squid-like [Uranotaenia lowii]|uniref:RNA-binding protein squid-like n=1 Tax=Uranotaenia lowii TaxID=190385 RepID=UPI002478635A|nr:RNA-binding protein squid-like [Uranotaenia lowii]